MNARRPFPSARERSPESSRATLDLAEVPRSAVDFIVASGRRYAVEAGEIADRLVVRSAAGEILLKLEIGDGGPVLRFEAAELVLHAARKIELAANEIAIRTTGDLEVDVGGQRRTRVAEDDRLEAAKIELQASEAGVAIRAMESIHLDGEHIGLNDDPTPRPFDWSHLAREEARR